MSACDAMSRSWFVASTETTRGGLDLLVVGILTSPGITYVFQLSHLSAFPPVFLLLFTFYSLHSFLLHITTELEPSKSVCCFSLGSGWLSGQCRGFGKTKQQQSSSRTIRQAEVTGITTKKLISCQCWREEPGNITMD